MLPLMWRVGKNFIICSFLLAVGLWYGARWYFTHVYPIQLHVQQQVIAQMNAQHSSPLSYSEIPAMYRKAVIATEDRTFETNIGISFRGIGRALWVDIRGGQALQGGSTITQQLVHNTVLRQIPKSIGWKFIEMLDSVGLYDTMSKADVFMLYANDIYFGQQAYGLYAASEAYFGLPPSQLNAGELTMLAGLPNAPSDYDPFVNMKLARMRQKFVVSRMVLDGQVTKTQANAILNDPIQLQ